MVWAICHQAAGMLDLPDCVVYLRDHAVDQELVQRAAFGPKNPHGQELLDPISIRVGSGIVGSVAAAGKPERIPDTSRDRRYIVDDDFRLSELAVPIFHEGEVIGVVDSEHPEKEYLRVEHLDALNLLVGMWADRLGRAWRQESHLLPRASGVLLNGLQTTDPSREPIESRQQMLGVLNHELRTPLNAILGYGSLLAETGSGNLDREQQELVRSLLRNGHELEERLVKVLSALELSSADSSLSKTRRLVDLNALVRQAVASANRPDAKVTLRIEVPVGVELETDARLLTSAVRELVDNALRHTQQGEVTIRLGGDGPQGLQLVVEDSGCGIPAEEIERVFQPFYQLGSSGLSRASRGLGLGLTLARRSCERLGYRLEVKSEVGVGSAFSLHFGSPREPGLRIRG